MLSVHTQLPMVKLALIFTNVANFHGFDGLFCSFISVFLFAYLFIYLFGERKDFLRACLDRRKGEFFFHVFFSAIKWLYKKKRWGKKLYVHASIAAWMKDQAWSYDGLVSPHNSQVSLLIRQKTWGLGDGLLDPQQ